VVASARDAPAQALFPRDTAASAHVPHAAATEAELLAGERSGTLLYFSGAADDFDTDANCPNVALHAAVVRRALLSVGGTGADAAAPRLQNALVRATPHNMRGCNGSALSPGFSGCEEMLKRRTAAEMAGARYCAVAAGDTPSTGRLYDAIACLCVPLIVVDDLERPFPLTHPLPPAALGLTLPEAELLAGPLQALERALGVGELGRASDADRSWRDAQAALLPARRALSYRRHDSDIATLVMREAWAGCLQKRHTSARPPDEVAQC
jgi:hypothetical protein